MAKHHYIPEFFLGAWTDTGTRDGRMSVLDKRTGKTWTTRPANAGAEGDLYLIDLSEIGSVIAADEIEKAFSKVEDAAAPSIKRVLTGGSLTGGEDLDNVIALLATLVLRVPRHLKGCDDLLRQMVDSTYRQLQADGKFATDNPALDAKMGEMYEQGLIQIKIKHNARLDMMVQGLTTVMELLKLRHWTVLRSANDAGDLICTDHPVVLQWYKPVPDGYSPGLGLKNTVVFSPLGPRTALVGLWNAEPESPELTDDQVTFWNSQLLGYVERFAFCRGDFKALHRSGAVDGKEDVLKRWAKS